MPHSYEAAYADAARILMDHECKELLGSPLHEFLARLLHTLYTVQTECQRLQGNAGEKQAPRTEEDVHE